MFVKVLQSFDKLNTARLNPRLFAAKVCEFVQPLGLLKYSVRSIANEFKRVALWFSSGHTYYDAAGNIRSSLGHVAKPLSTKTCCHMNGDVNPKTSAIFLSFAVFLRSGTYFFCF